MQSFDLIARSPADLPRNVRLFPISVSCEQILRVCSTVRPDVRVLSDRVYLRADDWLSATGPDFLQDIEFARTSGMRNRSIVFPETGGSYHEYFSVPQSLLRRDVSGNLLVYMQDMTGFVAGLGDFFGRANGSEFCHERIRYQPRIRMNTADPDASINAVLDMLGDDMSRSDFIAALSADPAALWKHWWRDLYNGIQYLDYVSIEPGSTIINCGVHGGFEVPHFVAALGRTGRIVDIDPLGHDYLLEPVRAFLERFSGGVDELRVALHDSAGTINIPVEIGGMAAGNCIDQKIAGTSLMSFRAASIDAIVDELSLRSVDFIKMDIEGAEVRALYGATSTLLRFRPSLAISIYHEPDHFVEIPLFLRRLLPNYKFFVRAYHFIANEVILYAIPNERPLRPRTRSIVVDLVD